MMYFFAKPFLYSAHDKREFIPSWISAPVHHPQPRERCKACEEFDEAIQLLRLDRRSYERTGALLGSPNRKQRGTSLPISRFKHARGMTAVDYEPEHGCELKHIG